MGLFGEEFLGLEIRVAWRTLTHTLGRTRSTLQTCAAFSRVFERDPLEWRREGETDSARLKDDDDGRRGEHGMDERGKKGGAGG